MAGTPGGVPPAAVAVGRAEAPAMAAAETGAAGSGPVTS